MPALFEVADARWLAFLQQEKVKAWYCPASLPKFLKRLVSPGAISQPDDRDGASDGDAIYAPASIVAAARRAAQAIAEGRKPTKDDKRALWLIAHEYLHCCVDWTPTPEQARRLDHPTKPVPAILHAFATRCKLNAFTRVLRRRAQPQPEYGAFLAWLHEVKVWAVAPTGA